MVTISVQEANKKLADALKPLSGPEASTAIARAINHTLNKGRTTVKRNVKQDYDIKEADFTSNLTVWKANKNKLQGYINANSKPISLSHFNPTFQFTSGGQAKQLTLKRTKKGAQSKLKKIKSVTQVGVSFTIKKGETKNLPFAFMLNSKKVVFARGEYSGTNFITRHKRKQQSGNDVPISKIISVSIFGTTQNENVQQRNMVDMTADYEKRLMHEINFLTSKIK